MKKFNNLVIDANKALKLADNMTYVTYPLLKDKKLLMPILENINKSITLSISAFIRYDLLYKRINSTPEKFNEKLNLFYNTSFVRYSFNEEDLSFIKSLNNLIKKHKESPIEIIRGEKFIICSEDYRTEIITLDLIKKMILKAKPFIFKLNRILSDERILKKSKK